MYACSSWRLSAQPGLSQHPGAGGRWQQRWQATPLEKKVQKPSGGGHAAGSRGVSSTAAKDETRHTKKKLQDHVRTWVTGMVAGCTL